MKIKRNYLHQLNAKYPLQPAFYRPVKQKASGHPLRVRPDATLFWIPAFAEMTRIGRCLRKIAQHLA
jgi:hypothetical protein